MFNTRCHWCGMETFLCSEQIPLQATIDHVIPRGRGGDNSLTNAVLACYACNQRRNKESILGLPDGHLLVPKPPKTPIVDTLRRQLFLMVEQRDQAHSRIRRQNIEIKRLQHILATVSIWSVFKRDIKFSTERIEQIVTEIRDNNGAAFWLMRLAVVVFGFWYAHMLAKFFLH